MRTLQLNRNSWHYKIAKGFGWRTYDEDTRRPNDFCSYARRLALAFLVMSFATAAGVFLIGSAIMMTVDLLVWFVHGIFNKFTYMGDFAIGALILYTVMLGVFCLFCVIEGPPKWLTRSVNKCLNVVGPAAAPVRRAAAAIPRPHLSPDTKKFLSAAWESFHDKVCFKLEFKE